MLSGDIGIRTIYVDNIHVHVYCTMHVQCTMYNVCACTPVAHVPTICH